MPLSRACFSLEWDGSARPSHFLFGDTQERTSPFPWSWACVSSQKLCQGRAASAGGLRSRGLSLSSLARTRVCLHETSACPAVHEDAVQGRVCWWPRKHTHRAAAWDMERGDPSHHRRQDEGPRPPGPVAPHLVPRAASSSVLCPPLWGWTFRSLWGNGGFCIWAPLVYFLTSSQHDPKID